jgi:hypothetical protein
MDKIDKTPIDKDFSINNQKSNQENTQDLDQEQNVTTNPFQFNSQNVKIILSNSQNNYSGKITGTTYLDKYNEIVSDVIILLYFGNDMAFPVCKTFSNKSGKFAIEDIPPGYYKIRAFMGKDYMYLSNYIKVLPCNSIDHPIFLKENIKK